MTLRCRAGDLAECIAGEFVGHQCEVVTYGGELREDATGEMVPGWFVEFPTDMPWGFRSSWMTAREGWHPDKWLRPIRPQAECTPANPIAVPATEEVN